ncbi:uncharacterized protein LOC121282010 [Carcharodon carcharias]|uniref:uncharacterized protein LOC121282010 n=1 Tax=Carcharodon carcharias TaxID=13397 RepID=UPI001B7E1F66|nr:uncharacterized protein LOC121282010 [Carcharodon carcharias]
MAAGAHMVTSVHGNLTPCGTPAVTGGPERMARLQLHHLLLASGDYGQPGLASAKTRAECLETSSALIFVNKTMWILILLICSLPVSGALWAKERVTGVVGRAITIECHYDARSYKSHIKYWCQGWTRECNVVASTNQRNGGISVTDNKATGIFIVTMEDLHSGDTGWYSCGIDKPGLDSMFAVWIQISNEPVSVPVFRFSSPPNVSCSGGSVSVSCESVQGSLSIQYTWYEKILSEDSKISDTNKLDLHCQSFKQQHHQYYCTASNNQGEKPSKMINVLVFNVKERTCSYMIQISSIVSGALWAKERVTGVVGRAITIECHYDATDQPNRKYWCHNWNRQCYVFVMTSWQNPRMLITDNKSQGIFVVTMKELHSENAGSYSCGIQQPGNDLVFAVELQVSYGAFLSDFLYYSQLKCLINVLSGRKHDSSDIPRLLSNAESCSFMAESATASEKAATEEDTAIGEVVAQKWRWRLQGTSVESDTSPVPPSSHSRGQVLEPAQCQDELLGKIGRWEVEKAADQEKNGRRVLTKPNRLIINMNIFQQTCSSVSGALWAKERVTGVVGRAITIECHYDARSYKSHIKYWCHGWTRQCNVVASTNWRNGRISVTDNKTQGIFNVTMEDLRSGDTGWYSCGIEVTGHDPMFVVWLQISYEPVSVPVLRFSTPANVSCSGGSVSVSCESVQGSLPIQYTWYEKTLSEDSKISDTNKLDLHCQSFKQQHHQYYCTASNNQGEKSSEMVNISKINVTTKNCSYVIQIGNVGPEYFCEDSATVSPTTHLTSTDIISTTIRSTPSDPENPESLIYIVLGVLGGILVVFAVSLLPYLRQINKGTNSILSHRRDKTLHDNQELAAEEESTVYANVNHNQRSSAGTHREGTAELNNEEITYAAVQLQKKSSTQRGEGTSHSVNNPDSVIYSGVMIHNQPTKKNP